MQRGAFLHDEAHDPGGRARGLGIEPLFDGARGRAEQVLEVARRDAPEVAHELHRLVGAGDAVELGRFLEFFDVYIEPRLFLEPVGDVFACDLWHGSRPFLFRSFSNSSLYFNPSSRT